MKDWKTLIIYALIGIIAIIIVFYVRSTPGQQPGVYEQPGKCPICQEQLTKYCYGHYVPHFAYSCANGCEDRRES